MSEQTHDDVNWAEVERRAFHRQLLGLLLVPVVLGSFVLVTGKFTFWEGADAWWAIAGFTAYALVGMGVSRATLRLRVRAHEGARMHYALRHHIDPGPELRKKVDRYARMMSGNGWMTWLFPFIPGSFLIGRWSHPLAAVPSILVILAVLVAVMVWWRRVVASAHRWVADPPGPEREAYALKAWERWIFGRRFMWLLLGVALVNVVVLTVLALVLR